MDTRRTAAPAEDAPLPARLSRAVASVPYWHHSIDLGHGVVTPGLKTPEHQAMELEALRLPDLEGRSVLDVGTWDGFYAFEAERRGAARVVALDSYMWGQDLRGWAPPERRAALTEPVPGRRGFDIARDALGSAVEPVVMEVTDLAPERIGSFDVVLLLGVVYHMRHPLAALERAASVTRDLLIVETALNYDTAAADRAMWEFFEGDELAGDPSNWWVPNARGLLALLRAAGFARAELFETPWRAPDPIRPEVVRGRAIAHARR